MSNFLYSAWRTFYTLFFENIAYVLFVMAIFIAVSLWRHKKLKKPFHPFHEGGFFLLVLWMTAIAMMTFIPQFSFGVAGGKFYFNLGVHFGIVPEQINLIPFQVFQDIQTAKNALDDTRSQWYLVVNIACNLVMLAPLGFFLPLLWKKFTLPKVLLCGLGCTLLIEFCQLFEQGKRTDIDDVWMNVIGILLGYLLFLLVRKCFPAFFRRFRVEQTQS